MKELENKVIGNLQFVILAYALYSVVTVYQEHTARMEELNTQFEPIETQIAANNKKVKEMQEFVKKAEESKVRVEEVAKNIESAQKQLPAEINDNEILTFFNEEITQLNIKDPSILPGREVASTYFISKEYTLSAKGTFLQLLVFLERIGSSTRIYNVKKFKMVNGDPNQKGRFQMINAEGTIEAFRYNPDFKVDRGFDPATTKAP